MISTADRSRNNRYGLPFIAALLLHVGLVLLAWVSWVAAPKPAVVASVPVELVSQVPMHEQMETPVDKLAVKTPTPEPAPEETPKPTPQPVPAPKLPVPAPQKEVVKPEPVKTPPVKPTPAPPKPVAKETPAPPDKNGMKKPQPDTKAKPAEKAAPPPKPSLDLNALSQIAAQPSKSHTRTPAQANTHATNGNSNFGAAPADAGAQTALTALTKRLQGLWNPSCDVPGFNTVHPDIRFMISPNGRVVQGPEWVNGRKDPIWEAAASRAKSAVKQGELYDDLPKELYNQWITITFDGHGACS
ncbi:hypothetical protein [Asticcacaulis solisilvae]|uniref:hypothetical protein n=1 Tax=Asticcacaulis solisilvae TaxID=1217274 RepID=UPI003FD783AC